MDEIESLRAEIDAAMSLAQREFSTAVGGAVPAAVRERALLAGVASRGAETTTVLVRDRLEFEVRRSAPGAHAGRRYHNPTEELGYTPFFADFGPLNLGKLYRHCERTDALLRECARDGQSLVLWTFDHPHQRSNAAFLASAYLVVRAGLTAEEAFTPFIGIHPPLAGYRDAAFGLCSFSLSVLDCLRGLEAAIRLGMFAFETFDIEAYEHDELLPNGDINWLVPGKFVAFSGPLDAVKTLAEGRTTWSAAQYAKYFKRHGVKSVVRLNKACYDKRAFTSAGIRHYDLIFPDGGLPPPAILSQFFDVCDRTEGAVGVHCKAGLGRTGTCIGAFVMKHYRMSARAFIAWSRICRPGSVLGPQQHYLETIEAEMWSTGEREGRHAALKSQLEGRPPVRSFGPLGNLFLGGTGSSGLASPTTPTSPSLMTLLVVAPRRRRTGTSAGPASAARASSARARGRSHSPSLATATSSLSPRSPAVPADLLALLPDPVTPGAPGTAPGGGGSHAVAGKPGTTAMTTMTTTSAPVTSDLDLLRSRTLDVVGAEHLRTDAHPIPAIPHSVLGGDGLTPSLGDMGASPSGFASPPALLSRGPSSPSAFGARIPATTAGGSSAGGAGGGPVGAGTGTGGSFRLGEAPSPEQRRIASGSAFRPVADGAGGVAASSGAGFATGVGVGTGAAPSTLRGMHVSAGSSAGFVPAGSTSSGDGSRPSTPGSAVITDGRPASLWERRTASRLVADARAELEGESSLSLSESRGRAYSTSSVRSASDGGAAAAATSVGTPTRSGPVFSGGPVGDAGFGASTPPRTSTPPSGSSGRPALRNIHSPVGRVMEMGMGAPTPSADVAERISVQRTPGGTMTVGPSHESRYTTRFTPPPPRDP